MEIEANTTIIAPGALHLGIYREIIRQKGGCLNISVLSLETYLAQNLTRSRSPKIVLLYQYARALESLNPDNLFYGSRNDYDFLNDCLNFMILCQLYDFQSFPKRTKREQDLAEVIEKILPIELWVKEAKSLPYPDASRLRILNTENSFVRQYWVDLLVSRGAKLVELKNHKRTYYWSCSNARKEMEACADAIVANQLNADDVMIALADSSQKYVLAQALESRGIPYTMTESDSSRKIIEQWKSALTYLMDRSDENLMDLLETLFAQSAYSLRRYIRLFGSADVSIQNMTWEDNALIPEETFAELQALEVEVSPWRPVLEQIRGWTLDSIDQIGRVIMDQTPSPEPDDVNAFEGVMSAITSVLPMMNSEKDLELLIRSLDTLRPSRALSSLKGVLVGSREQISGLYDNVFYIGADAHTFPGSQAFTGIFDEDYMQQLPFPSLEERTQKSFDQLTGVLMEPESLFILTPQSDYMGKAIENSHELNTWLGMLPKFRKAAEPSSNPRPSFRLQGMPGSHLFRQSDGVLQTGVNSLNTFEKCALRNLLQYGLCLRSPIKARDLLHVGGDLIERTMQRGYEKYRVTFDQLSDAQIEELIKEDFAFAKKLFEARAEEIDALAEKTVQQLIRIFASLRPVRQEMHLGLAASDYRIDMQENFEGLLMHVEGSIARTTRNRAAFNLVDTGEDSFMPDALPRATIDLRMQPKARERNAFVLRYGAGGTPASANPVSKQQAIEQSRVDFFKDTLVAQNFSGMSGPLEETLKKKVPTYGDREEKISEQADGLARSLNNNDFRPVHKPNACATCHFKSICRNAATEKE